MAIERRNSSLDSFIDDPEVKVLIASPGAAKEGLTLTVANNVIFYDRSFSLDDYLQAQDRIHRISQNKICNIYNLIMKDSIDEWVDILIDSKSLMAQLTQGDISIDYYKSKISYSFGDVLKNILDNKKGVA
jgi:SNF2 family DNA or RNA helicase